MIDAYPINIRGALSVISTKELRRQAKKLDQRIAVHPGAEGQWIIRAPGGEYIKQLRKLFATIGLQELSHEVAGTRWDWIDVLRVTAE
jgi:hypothetical protein